MPTVLKKKARAGRARPEPTGPAPNVPPPNPPPQRFTTGFEALADFAARGMAAQNAVDELGAGKPSDVPGFTQGELHVVVDTLRERGDDLKRYAARDGDDLRVRGEAMHALAVKLLAAGNLAAIAAARAEQREPALDEVRDLERIHHTVELLRADPHRDNVQRVLNALSVAAAGTPLEYTWNKLLHLTWDPAPGSAPR